MDDELSHALRALIAKYGAGKVTLELRRLKKRLPKFKKSKKLGSDRLQEIFEAAEYVIAQYPSKQAAMKAIEKRGEIAGHKIKTAGGASNLHSRARTSVILEMISQLDLTDPGNKLTHDFHLWNIERQRKQYKRARPVKVAPRS